MKLYSYSPMAASRGELYTTICVAAIDIGNTYSGYAFSFHGDFQKKPLKIFASGWNAGSGSLILHKTPTALLLNPDQTFNSFGYNAEKNYSQLAEEDEHKDYYYFRRFQTILRKGKSYSEGPELFTTRFRRVLDSQTLT
ncbi:heat shock 70 kDa protein 12B-like [Mizuhopecten yessoensis]|uniref:heat shock 70 kDa protein 12B-like n=1 Tax=Mizuhopecten yessoensis TaxID=6573 RepID=UPI000B458C39|nr:heat shock 70 kDa protein 12B-like [Mizuhopecten yessoensis]